MSNQNGSGSLRGATFPPGGDDPDFPWPGAPHPGQPPSPGTPGPGPVPPTRVWLDPHAGWQDTLSEGLLEQRIVLASGVLDDPAATRLSAQLLTLDAEGDGPIRLELQNLRSDLPAARAGSRTPTRRSRCRSQGCGSPAPPLRYPPTSSRRAGWSTRCSTASPR